MSIYDASNAQTDAGNEQGNNPTTKQPADAHRTNDVIENICNHSLNENKNDWSYRLHWYNQDNSHDTCEPLTNLTRNAIVSYRQQKDITLPHNIDQALDG